MSFVHFETGTCLFLMEGLRNVSVASGILTEGDFTVCSFITAVMAYILHMVIG
jgi:hypothetical protein